MSLLAHTVRAQGVPVRLRPRAGATRTVHGIVSRTFDPTDVGGRSVAVQSVSATLVAGDAEGVAEGDAVDVGEASYTVSAVRGDPVRVVVLDLEPA